MTSMPWQKVAPPKKALSGRRRKGTGQETRRLNIRVCFSDVRIPEEIGGWS